MLQELSKFWHCKKKSHPKCDTHPTYLHKSENPEFWFGESPHFFCETFPYKNPSNQNGFSCIVKRNIIEPERKIMLTILLQPLWTVDKGLEADRSL